tara:strand:- start:277 stop:465 length:189 start_codon:yes stop_codon:yes gene_type:complete
MDKTKGLIFGTPAAITRYIAANGSGAAAKKYTRKSIQEAQKITKDKVVATRTPVKPAAKKRR